MRTYVHVYVHTYIRTCEHANMRTYVHTHVRTYVPTYLRTYGHMCIRTSYVHTYVRTTMDLYYRRPSHRVAWPSGLRRWFKAPVSSEARVRIPPLPMFFDFTLFVLELFYGKIGMPTERISGSFEHKQFVYLIVPE